MLVCFLSVSLAQERVELRHFPLDSIDELLTKEGVRIDSKISTDHGGSLLLRANGETRVPLVETGSLDIESAEIIFRGKMRVVSLKGDAYLEVTCELPGQGGDFGTRAAIRAEREPPLDRRGGLLPFAQGGEAENVRVSLVATAKGRIWLDDLRLETAPLRDE